MAVQIRAAVLRARNLPRPYFKSKPLTIENVWLDPPGPGEVMVDIKAAGLCHSDLSTVNGDRPRQLPMVLGHEASGVVSAVGPHVTRFAVGDPVICVFVPSCGTCVPCSGGRPALCEPGAAANTAGTLTSNVIRLRSAEQKYLNEPIHHHLGVSCFAEKCVVSERSLVRIPLPVTSSAPSTTGSAAAVSFQNAALFGCAVLTGAGAVLNTAQLKAGQSVAVLGLGGVGLSSLLGARAGGAATTIAIDPNPSKLTLAKELGCTHAFDSADPELVQKVKAVTGGGVDIAAEMAGSAAALEAAFAVTRRGGSTVSAGFPNPAARVSISPVTLVAEERRLLGSYVGGCVPQRDIPAYMRLFQAGILPVHRLLSNVISLDQINEGFERLAEGSSVREVIVF